MAHVSTTLHTGSAGPGFTVPVPAASPGDIVRVAIYFSANMTMVSADAQLTPTIAGFGSAGYGRLYEYWRRVDGTEGATWAFTASNTFSWRGIAQVLSGRIRTGSPFVATVTEEFNASGAFSIGDTLTGVTDHCDLVADYTRASTSSAGTWSPPTGMVEQVDNSLMGAATQDDVAAGTYAKTAGQTGSSAGPKIFLGALVAEPAPGVPTTVTPTAVDDDVLSLSWAAPASGGVVDHYEVRLDGGAAVTATSPHAFSGLDPSTTYDLEVRAVGPALSSAWVLVSETTLAEPVPTPPGYYRVELSAGPYSWTVERGDPVEYGVRLPLSLGWAIGESVEFFPAQPDPATLTFGVLVGDATELVDLVRGAAVSFRMFVEADPEAPSWQRLDGVVTQVDGEVTDDGDFLVRVYCAESVMALDGEVVGWTVDWPIESIGDRLDRIMGETSLGVVDTYMLGTGLEGWLAGRNQAPVTALAAIRAALKDAANENDSEPPDTWYGRHVYTLDPDGNLVVAAWERRAYDTVTLDGCLVHARGAQWVRPPVDTGTWVLVDGVTFGTPSGPPIWRSTSLLDYFGDPPGSELNYSAATRDALGNSLLPDGSTQLSGWFTRVIRYDAHVTPEPVTYWASPQLWLDLVDGLSRPAVIAVVVTPLADGLDVNDAGYLAGSLTGARMTIPPGGEFYVDVTLRPELLAGTDLPA